MQLRRKLREIRLARKHRRQNVGHHIAAKHRTARQHFIQDTTKRPHIGATVYSWSRAPVPGDM